METALIIVASILFFIFLALLGLFYHIKNNEPDTNSTAHMLKKLKATTNEWQINYNELNFQRRIGKGSQGEVFSAKWRGSTFAVKKIDTREVSKDTIEEFCQEASMMKRLQHPALTLFMGVSMQTHNLCIVTEYAHKGSLFDIMRHEQKSRALSWLRALQIAYDVAKGMMYLHSYTPPILHRDLKSLNILVDKNWRGKIADFGMTRFSEDGTYMSQCGSPLWMSPEMISNKKYNEKADVFSFGIVLWEIYTRKIPYRDLKMSANKLVALVVRKRARPTIPPEMPKKYRNLMVACWAHHAADRPSFVQIVTKLKAMLSNSQILAHIPNSSRKLLQMPADRNDTDSISEIKPQLVTMTNWNLNEVNSNKIAMNIDDVNKLIAYKTIEQSEELIKLIDLPQNKFKETKYGRFRHAKATIHKFNVPCDEEIYKLNMSRLSDIRHPNIALFLASFYNYDHTLVITEELQLKNNLYAVLMEGSLIIEWSLMFQIFLDIASGLNYLHNTSQPIFHADLRTHRLYFDNSMNVKIADVGLIDISKQITNQRAIPSQYTAPEVFLDPINALSAKANVYTFALIMWQVIVRKPLFNGEQMSFDLQDDIVYDNRRPKLPDYISKDLKKLIESCWAKDPNDRPLLKDIIISLKKMKKKGPPPIILIENTENVVKYRKKATIFAYKSKDPISILKDWGKNCGEKNCYIIHTPPDKDISENDNQTISEHDHDDKKTSEDDHGGDDIYVINEDEFLETYEQIEGTTNEYRKIGTVLAKRMDTAFVFRNGKDGTITHGLCGDYFVQKTKDDQWTIEADTFLKLYIPC